MAFHRFMDLPSEVRLMIYGRVARTIYQYRILIGDRGRTNVGFILILRTIDLGILTLCRTVHDEANGIMQRIIEQFILEKLPQLGGTQHESIFVGLEVIMGAADLEADRISNRRRLFELGYIREVYWDGPRDAPIMSELHNIGVQMRSWKRPAHAKLMNRFEQDMPIIVRWVKQAGQQLHYNHRLRLRQASLPASTLRTVHFRYITVFSCSSCRLIKMDEEGRKNSHSESHPSCSALSFFHHISRMYQHRVFRRTSVVEIQGHVYDPTGGRRLTQLRYEHWELPNQAPRQHRFSMRAQAAITTSLTMDIWRLEWEPTKYINSRGNRRNNRNN